MKRYLAVVFMVICLTGCSELRVIGSAAIREIQAEALPVNWGTAKTSHVSADRKEVNKMAAAVKVKSFSSFRSSPLAMKKPVKGLWEKHGS